MDFVCIGNDMVVRDDVPLRTDHKAGTKGLSHLWLRRLEAGTTERTKKIVQRRLALDNLFGRYGDHGRNFLAVKSFGIS